MTVWVLLPAYNEAEAISSEILGVCGALEAHQARVVVVDDGSLDGTAELAEQLCAVYPVEVLRHKTNRGLGHALTTGLRHIIKEGEPGDAVVVKDADGTQPAELVPGMLALLEEGSEVVVASRYRRGARQLGLRPGRKLLRLVGNAVYSLAAAVPGVRDYTSGFRAFGLASLARAAGRRWLIERAGFGATAELLLKVTAAGAKASEIPLVLRYNCRAGPSKMRAVDAIGESLRVLWQKS